MARPATKDAERQSADLLTPAEAASYLDVDEYTLSNWRSENRGPKYIKMGDRRQSRVKYRRADLRRFLENMTVNTRNGRFR